MTPEIDPQLIRQLKREHYTDCRDMFCVGSVSWNLLNDKITCMDEDEFLPTPANTVTHVGISIVPSVGMKKGEMVMVSGARRPPADVGFKLTSGPADWHEDVEAGCSIYTCSCAECKGQFSGHKRRHLCRLCSFPQQGVATEHGKVVDNSAAQD